MGHSRPDPLVINIGYSLGNGLVRNSGWRYNLPVDWVGILYYAIGLTQLIYWVLMYFTNHLVPKGGLDCRYPVKRYFRAKFPWKIAIPVALGFIMVSATLPLVERAIPNRYEGTGLEQILTSLNVQGAARTWFHSSGDQSYLQQKCRSDRSGFVSALLRCHKGENETGWPEHVPTDLNRFGFYVAGEERAFILLPMDEAPANFPNASDVFVLGCREPRYILADRVVVLVDPPVMLPDSRSPLASCSTGTQPE
jgi:hypothetical protein